MILLPLVTLLLAVASDVESSTGLAEFTGWSCPSGPEELVSWLVERSEEVDYALFAEHVDLSTAPLDENQMEILPTDWHVNWLKTELPSGKPVWVMQHGGIEHLFARGGVDTLSEGQLAVALIWLFEELEERDDVRIYDRSEADVRSAREHLMALQLVQIDEEGLVVNDDNILGRGVIHFETGVPVTLPFSRNTEPAPYLGEQYAQHIEPKGRYLIRLGVEPEHVAPGWVHGVVHFESPLVLKLRWPVEGRYAGPAGWKSRLVSAFGTSGLPLSQALRRAGYDAIVTVTMSGPQGRPGYTSEIVDLTQIEVPDYGPFG